MSVSVSRFSWWYWSNGKEKERKISSSDSMKLSSSFNSNKKDGKISSQKKVKKKWNSREKRRNKEDKEEYDVVLVPSDGVCCLSASDDESSYDSDWSIGWMEPHAPDFYHSDDEQQDVNDSSFAVLVPCYRNDCKAFKSDPANNHFLNVMPNANFPAPEGNKYMEQWIASLQNF